MRAAFIAVVVSTLAIASCSENPVAPTGVALDAESSQVPPGAIPVNGTNLAAGSTSDLAEMLGPGQVRSASMYCQISWFYGQFRKVRNFADPPSRGGFTFQFRFSKRTRGVTPEKLLGIFYSNHTMVDFHTAVPSGGNDTKYWTVTGTHLGVAAGMPSADFIIAYKGHPHWSTTGIRSDQNKLKRLRVIKTCRKTSAKISL